MTLSRADVTALLDYSPESGAFSWRSTGAGRKASAGTRSNNGYTGITIKGRRYQAHRLAMLIHSGVWPEHDVDHINGDRSDNRLANLRCATRAENMQNQHILQARNTSGHRGVVERGGRWLARIAQRHLGTFASKAEAVIARQSAERVLFPNRSCA